jgi:hypothetical protein
MLSINFRSFTSKTQNAELNWAFELNSAAAAAETWDLKGHILRCGRMWSRTILKYHLWN